MPKLQQYYACPFMCLPASVAAQQKLEIRISAAATLVNFDNVRLSSTVVDEQYAYDSNGNRLSTTGARQSALGSHNRLQTDGTYNYVYDNEGNIIRRTQISDGSVLEYQWDHRNRLTKISTKAAGATVSSRDIFYYYDAFDRRVGKTIDYEGNGVIDRSWVYVFDGQNTVMVLQDAGGVGSMQGYRVSERILQGPAVDMVMSEEIYSGTNGPLVGSSIASSNSGTTLWTIGDDQGSIQDAVDNNGVIRRRVNYNAFGQRTNQTDTDANGQALPTNSTTALDTLFGYTGRDWDSDAQLQNNRARWYDPTTARWLSQDPIGFNAGDSNLYRYVGSSPANATDPSGLSITPIQPKRPESWWHTWIVEPIATPDPADFLNPIGMVAKPLTKPLGAVVAKVLGKRCEKATINEIKILANVVEKSARSAPTVVTSPSRSALINAPDNVAHNAANFARYKDELRAAMSKPHVTDAELARYMDELYRQGAQIGSGSTAAAVRHELATGGTVGGRTHSQKARDMITALQRWLKNNPTASSGDRAAAENVIQDMLNALNGN